MAVAEILYEIEWTWPGGSPSGHALAPHGSARQIESALLAAGYRPEDVTVKPSVPGPACGRHAAPRVDEPLVGASARQVGEKIERTGLGPCVFGDNCPYPHTH